MLTQRDWDIAQLESDLRVQGWFREWVKALMEGRNPLDKLPQMTPQEALNLQNRPPVQILPESAGPSVGQAPQIVPPPEEEI